MKAVTSLSRKCGRPPTPSELLQVAVAACRAAGRHAARNLDRRKETILVTAHDVKLALDVECQKIAERRILSAFPDHAILGEETAGETAPDHSPYVWIIDPIDGTVNFSHGLPFWCCSVAVQQAGQTVAGAVFGPALGELFTATQDGPALRNGKPIRVSDTSRMESALVMTGLDQKLSKRMNRLTLFKAIAENVRKARVMGAAALDACRVAAGQADAYFESGIYSWDVAAAGLIVERAGGQIETLATPGPHRLIFLASNRLVHFPLRRLIKSHLAL